MAAPSALVLTQNARQYIGDATDLLGQSTYKAALVTSSWTQVNTVSLWGDISANEVASGNGYTTGGVTLTGPSFTQTGGVGKFTTSSNPAWTGASSGFAARSLVLYASGTFNGHLNPIVGYMYLDSTPADVSFAAGNTVTVTMNASGWLTLT
jgi:hypothetical protein